MELIERDQALQCLADALASTGPRSGRSALVTGEAGIGKTSVVLHFASTLGDTAEMFWGLCDALFTPV